jgi:(p)ppGpp synthase/HD superfamily hydrolase
MATLIDYGYINSVLLKASICHDLLEDIPEFDRNLLLSIDFESHAVYELVMEVTRQGGETKPQFLKRIKDTGSAQAKILKCADRISNMISLGFVNDLEFIERYTKETVEYIFPIAEDVDANMLTELRDLVSSRQRYLEVWRRA